MVWDSEDTEITVKPHDPSKPETGDYTEMMMYAGTALIATGLV